jgi:hypothetical protein
MMLIKEGHDILDSAERERASLWGNQCGQEDVREGIL